MESICRHHGRQRLRALQSQLDSFSNADALQCLGQKGHVRCQCRVVNSLRFRGLDLASVLCLEAADEDGYKNHAERGVCPRHFVSPFDMSASSGADPISDIIVSIIRIVEINSLSFDDITYASWGGHFWSEVEIGVAMIVACAPMCKPAVEEWLPTRWKSAYTTSGSTFRSDVHHSISDDYHELGRLP